MLHRAPVFLLVLGFAVAVCAAQNPIASDRPGFGDGSAVMGPGQFQVEAGYGYAEAGAAKVHALGQGLVRLGLGARIELRLGLNSYLLQRAPADVSGFEDLVVGAKVGLIEGDGLPKGRPSLTALLLLSLPTGDDAFGAEGVQPELKFAADWALTEVVGLSANAGYASLDGPGDERIDLVTLILSIGTALPGTEGLGAYLGSRARFFEGGTDFFDIEAGLTYLLTPITQLDINAGTGLDGPSPNFFIGFGVARRL